MVVVNAVDAKYVLDSRKEKTISVKIRTSIGTFSASSPNGKSRGKHEAKPYKKNLDQDIKALKQFSDYFSEEKIEKFDDLRRIEDILEGHVGANSFFALESAILKAMAREQKKQIWQVINPNAKKFPRLVGNCIGGGKHTHANKKPDFQEFLLIPKTKSVGQAWEKNKKSKKKAEELLIQKDKNFQSKKNDEDAWITGLNEKEVLDILKQLKIPLGLDVAASSFYKRKKYHYENPMLKRTEKEQMGYLSNLIKNFDLVYIEDPFEEEDFENFSKLLDKIPNSLIVGDDLTTTNPKRFENALEKKSINAIIVKPNQIGSLIKTKEVCRIAKKNNIKIVFSHRSGETNEDILADLAFGFGADFFKCGITGKEREVKIKRLVEIERKLR